MGRVEGAMPRKAPLFGGFGLFMADTSLRGALAKEAWADLPDSHREYWVARAGGLGRKKRVHKVLFDLHGWLMLGLCLCLLLTPLATNLC